MGNQLAGFGGYPKLDGDMTYNLALFLRIANSANDRRWATCAHYVQDAITAAIESIARPPLPTPTSPPNDPLPPRSPAHGSGS